MYQQLFFITLAFLVLFILALCVVTYKGWKKSQRFAEGFYVKPYRRYWEEKYELLQPSDYYTMGATGMLLVPVSITGYDPVLMKMSADLIYRGYDYIFNTPGATLKDVDKIYSFMNYEKMYPSEGGDTVIIVQKDSEKNYKRIWFINRGVGNKDELVELLSNFYTNDMKLTQQPEKKTVRLGTMINVLQGETESMFEGVQTKSIDIYNNKSLKVINQLLTDYEITQRDQFIIIGHSFGGAVSLVIYRNLLDTYKDNMVCYTFNSVKVGNRIFKKNIPEDRFFRIFNTEDVVPSLPLASFYNWNTDKHENYYHVGKSYAFYDNSGSGTFNHSMDIVKLNQNAVVYLQDNSLTL